jgi:transcriptional/translational regulatory protein YebC/TACO1
MVAMSLLLTAIEEGGPDPGTNPRLASVLAAAKKAGFPKASWEAAIARGQGRSPSGVALESMVIEVLHSPTGVALVIDCMTDNRAKTLQEVREKLKSSDAVQAPVGYMFERRGRLRFGNATGDGHKVLEEDAVMEAALSAGALDVDFESPAQSEQSTEFPSESLVYTEPSEMAAVAEAMSKELGVKPSQKELIWHPNAEMMVNSGDGSEWGQLGRLIDQLEDDWTIAGVYPNAR